MEPKIPTALAVTLWVGSGLAVLTYTYIAFKETANGLESGAMDIVGSSVNPLVASAAILAAEEIKPLERGHFKQSGN